MRKAPAIYAGTAVTRIEFWDHYLKNAVLLPVFIMKKTFKQVSVEKNCNFLQKISIAILFNLHFT